MFLHGVSRSIAIAAAGYRLSVRYRLLDGQYETALDLARLARKGAGPQSSARFTNIADRLCSGLNLANVAVLQLDRHSQIYSVAYQRSRGSGLPDTLPGLNTIDERFLANGLQAIALKDLTRSTTCNIRHKGQDLDVRLSAWQPCFLASGRQAVAVSSTHIGELPDFAIAIGDVHPRDWSDRKLFLLQWAAQQVASHYDRARVEQQKDRTQTAIAAITSGLSDLRQRPTVTATAPRDRVVLQHVRQFLHVPCVALLRLDDGERARVSAAIGGEITPDSIVELTGESLWASCVKSEEFVGPVPIASLQPETRHWLGSSSPNGQLYALALRATPDLPPSAIFLALGHDWDESLLASARVLVDALLQAERRDRLTQQLYEKRNALEPLNWYKHRQMEALYWTLGSAGRQIERLVHQVEMLDSQDATIAQEADRERLFGQQTLRVLSENLDKLKMHLQKEQWQLSFTETDISLVTLLKRVLDRTNALLEKRQLWLQVHREGNTIIRSDRQKIELVFYELLSWACQRSPVGGRIDVWYRPTALGDDASVQFLELTITDNGTIDPHLVATFQACTIEHGGYSFESLTAPELDRAPGVHLAVYHELMTAMGGHFFLEVLEDGRTATRLLVPLSEAEQTRIQAIQIESQLPKL